MKNLLKNIKKAFVWLLSPKNRELERYLSSSSDIFELESRQKELAYNRNDKWM